MADSMMTTSTGRRSLADALVLGIFGEAGGEAGGADARQDAPGAAAREISHRVGNRLQVLASLLMQGARAATSPEMRRQLRAVHSRVISMTLTPPPGLEPTEDIDLQPYLTQLCARLNASITPARAAEAIVVSAEDRRVAADVAVSFGLIVIELVREALERAPSDAGPITLLYRAQDQGWTLTLSDEGAGSQTGGQKDEPAFGPRFVEILAQGLNATVGRSGSARGSTTRLTGGPVGT